MKNNLISIVIIGLVMSTSVFAEKKAAQKDSETVSSDVIQPPDTEIHLFELGLNNGTYFLGSGKNISNNLGYDNQPFFTKNRNTILFVSNRDGKQTDVYEYAIDSGKTTQITNTQHSEYSPKSLDKDNKISFVSEGGNPYQSVWVLDRKSTQSQWLFNSKEPVGYYAVNDSNGDVLFWSRYAWNVQYLNIRKNLNRLVSGDAIPSSPQRIPKSNSFSFVHRQPNGEKWIKRFDPSDFSLTPLAPLFGDNSDYAWSPNGDIFWVNENKIYIWSVDFDSPLVWSNQWKEVADLSGLIKGKVGRLAISPNGKMIAIVENR